jgi:hypothetical protein
MSTATEQLRPEPDEVDLRQAGLPPVARVATLALALVIAGGIWMAAHYDHHTTLVPAVVLAAAGGALVLVNVALLSRIPTFAWDVFFRVFGWTLLAYLVIAGILEYVFIFDHTPARQLALFSVMLALFAVDVPMLLAFSVARYQPVPG